MLRNTFGVHPTHWPGTRGWHNPRLCCGIPLGLTKKGWPWGRPLEDANLKSARLLTPSEAHESAEGEGGARTFALDGAESGLLVVVMPATVLAQICLRLFALYWLLRGVTEGATMGVFSFEGVLVSPAYAVGPVMYVLAGVWLWPSAPALAERMTMTRNPDEEASLQGVTSQQLYATAIMGVGLFFALKSVAGTINWLHYFVVNRSEGNFDASDNQSFYEFTREAVTLGVGLLLVFNAGVLARKLTRHGTKAAPPEQTHEQAGEQ